MSMIDRTLEHLTRQLANLTGEALTLDSQDPGEGRTYRINIQTGSGERNSAYTEGRRRNADETRDILAGAIAAAEAIRKRHPEIMESDPDN